MLFKTIGLNITTLSSKAILRNTVFRSNTNPTDALNKAIAKAPALIRTELLKTLQHKAIIPAEYASKWAKQLKLSTDGLMMALVPVAQQYARVPVSKYLVGAVAQGSKTGNLYFGSNMEFTGQALSFSVHAEQSALNNAMLNNEDGLTSLAISAAPCGYCRQFLYETTTADKLKIITKSKTPSLDNDTGLDVTQLTQLLPHAFGPKDLGIQGGLMEHEHHSLVVSTSTPLGLAALKCADASYAPYTSNYAGVALLINNNHIFAGRLSENAAYNPSMSPMESALAFANMNLPPQIDIEVNDAALVEAASVVSQKGATKDVLASIAPTVKLKLYTAEQPTATKLPIPSKL